MSDITAFHNGTQGWRQNVAILNRPDAMQLRASNSLCFSQHSNTSTNTEVHNFRQDRQCTYKVKLRRFRATIVAVGEQWVLHNLSVCVCVCSLRYLAENWVFVWSSLHVYTRQSQMKSITPTHQNPIGRSMTAPSPVLSPTNILPPHSSHYALFKMLLLHSSLLRLS